MRRRHTFLSRPYTRAGSRTRAASGGGISTSDDGLVLPLAPRAELAAHEQELLAGVGPHEGEVGTQIREFLPDVARHLVEERALAVHYLVMGERQDEVLGEGVEQAEGETVLVV